MTSYTPKLDLAKQDTGAQGWGTVLNQNFDKIDAGFGEIGVKVYSATVSYASGEFVIASVSGVVGLYKSLQGNNVGHALTDTIWWEAVPLSGSADVDGKSITKNSSDELQTIGVINQNDTTTAIKTWSGTKAQYDAIVTKDPNTLYNITDDTDISLTILEALYPVGSIYITTNAACPLSTLIAGSTWVLVSSGIVQAGDIPCKGNGMTLGLTNGTNNYGLNSDMGGNANRQLWYGGIYGATVGSTASGPYDATGSLGITTDETKSGIIADTSSLILAVNIFERTN